MIVSWVSVRRYSRNRAARSVNAAFTRKTPSTEAAVEHSALPDANSEMVEAGTMGRLVPATVERVSAVTYQEIAEALEKAPWSEREAIGQGYVGLRVEWDCDFMNGYKSRSDFFRIFLSLGATRTIHCDVRENEFRELTKMSGAARIRVAGVIDKAELLRIDLSDVRLMIYAERAKRHAPSR